MRASRAEIADLLARAGALRAADHPRLRDTLRRLVAAGVLERPFPGVYIDARRAGDLRIRALAASSWMPDAIVTGPSAAALTFWPELRVSELTISLARKAVGRAGVRCREERLPSELVMRAGPLQLTRPALTALDLVPTHGGAGIDEALRRRVATLTTMHEALELTRSRAGNVERRRLLCDSRDEPWSEAERKAHQLLRQGRIIGWRTNVAVRCFDRLYFLDIAFEAEKLGIEIDGWGTHGRREQFAADRRRWADLVAAGWTLLHFTWDQLLNEPDLVLDRIRTVRARLRRRAA